MKIQHPKVAMAIAALLHLSAFAQEPSSDNTNVIAIDIQSDDDGSTLRGTMAYSNEGSIRPKTDTKKSTGRFTLDHARKLVPGTWKINLEETARITKIDLTAFDDRERNQLAQIAFEFHPDREFPTIEALDGENCFRLTNGDKFVEEIRFINRNRITLIGHDGLSDMVFDRTKTTITLDRARNLLIGIWKGNPDETLKHSPQLDRKDDIARFTLEFMHDGSGILMDQARYGRRNTSGRTFSVDPELSHYTGQLKNGERGNHFQFGTLDFEFLNNDRIIYEGVVLDRFDAK